jgi:hypothetical protein
MDSVFTALDFASTLLVAGALAMIAFAHKELKAARLMLSIAAVGIIARWVMWSFSGDHHWVIRSAVGAIVGALLLGGLPALYRWASERDKAQEPNQPISTKPASNIAVECRSEMLPITVAPTGVVRALQLFPTPLENGGADLPTFFNFSGKEWQWPGSATATPPLLEGYRCEITNYDAVPIFDFLMQLDLTFFEAVDVPDQPNTKRQGPVKLRRDWQIDVPKIDVGSTNAFVFYIFNFQPDQFVNVLMPKTAIMRRLGETELRVIDLTVPSAGGRVPLMFGPRFDASNQK